MARHRQWQLDYEIGTKKINMRFYKEAKGSDILYIIMFCVID